jgi:hypothetical protein
MLKTVHVLSDEVRAGLGESAEIQCFSAISRRVAGRGMRFAESDAVDNGFSPLRTEFSWSLL